MRRLACLCLLVCGAAVAHPLSPALLDIEPTGDGGRYEVRWRTSVSSVARSASVEPVFDPRCRAVSPVQTRLVDGEALVSGWTLDCGGDGLVGTTVSVSAIDRAGINVVLRWKGSEFLLDGGTSSIVIPAETPTHGPLLDYAALGIHHLAIGADHLLFLAGLMWLVRAWRARIVALTAFTLGHGVTFALATLDLVRVEPGLAETAIAGTLLLLGAEMLRVRPGWIGRAPAAAALAFGLIHGLGFAGALRETGLPPQDVAHALLGFHLGIEAAQIAFVLGASALVMLIRRLPVRLMQPVAARGLAAYGIGTVAAYWFLERAIGWIG